MGLLWPDKDEDKARHSLNEALRVVRRSLGTALETEGDTIRIGAGAVASDADHLDDLPVEALGLRFMEGFVVPDAGEFDGWVALERDGVQARQLGVLARRGESALDSGDHAGARAAAQAALGLDPANEPAARLAMRAAALGGRRASALEAFEQLRTALAGLGLTPDKASRLLAERIRDERIVPQAPAPAPSGADLPLGGSARQGMAELAARWTAAARGAAQVVALVGDPGTGKTRLAVELAARARLDGATVLRLRAVPGETSRNGWSALLRDAFAEPALAGLAPAALASLAELEPDISVRFPAARSAAPLPLPDATQAALRALAEDRALLVILDDAQYAPADFLSELSRVVEQGRSLPVLLLLVAVGKDSNALDAVRARIGRDLPGAALATVALSPGDVDELVSVAFPAYSAAQRQRLARRIMADTAGNPFLATELVRAVRSGLTIPDTPAAWPSAKHTLDDTLPGDLPPSVAAALRMRFRELTPSAQQVLVAIAVLGPGAAESRIARGIELPPPDVSRALDELEWGRWIVADPRGYSFATRLAREVVLADMVTGGQQRRIREGAGQ